MGKILLYYKYVTIAYPKQIMKWQRELCQSLDLKGRILIGDEGINGTVGGSIEATEQYKQAMKNHELFGDIDFKESEGNAECFPKLQIKVRHEIVSLGIDPKKLTPKNGGKHLTPEETHELLNNKPDDLIIIDCRNDYEWKIGHFRDAIKPEVKNFREFPQYVDEHLDELKDKQVLMYCTGGIRCERASTYIKEKNIAKKVYQIQGGIHRYTEKYPDGHFRGKNYVFDGRIAVKVTDDILGNCSLCEKSCDQYINCSNVLCNKHVISCSECKEKYANCCSAQCQDLVAQKKVNQRPKFQKYDPTHHSTQ